jgi:hypothetical protein
MKILIACEFSGIVRDAFIKKGHDAISCDLLPTESPGPHYQGNVLDILNDGWDMMIAFPPCTHLAVSGAVWFEQKRKDGRQQQGIDFFMEFTKTNCPKIAIENPVGIMSTVWRKPDQIVHPWMFGHETTKATCLWLYNLPLLTATNIVGRGERKYYPSGNSSPIWHAKTGGGCGHQRSRTFSGLSDAMANQWG